MPAVIGPAGGSSSDFMILNLHISAPLNEKLRHCLMTIKRSVVQAASRIIKAPGDGVDLGTFFQKQSGGLDVSVHAGVHKSVVDDALAVIVPRAELCFQGVLSC